MSQECCNACKMTATELQKLIEAARGPYTPGIPMDALVDQDILCGIVDGLVGGEQNPQDPEAWKAGVMIGCKLRKTLR